MKNQYQILKDRQHKEFNAFPLGAAFSQTQFTEMMAKWGLEPIAREFPTLYEPQEPITIFTSL